MARGARDIAAVALLAMAMMVVPAGDADAAKRRVPKREPPACPTIKTLDDCNVRLSCRWSEPKRVKGKDAPGQCRALVKRAKRR
jgi:hypothetical protein